jgi:hypothetical protein
MSQTARRKGFEPILMDGSGAPHFAVAGRVHELLPLNITDVRHWPDQRRRPKTRLRIFIGLCGSLCIKRGLLQA